MALLAALATRQPKRKRDLQATCSDEAASTNSARTARGLWGLGGRTFSRVPVISLQAPAPFPNSEQTENPSAYLRRPWTPRPGASRAAGFQRPPRRRRAAGLPQDPEIPPDPRGRRGKQPGSEQAQTDTHDTRRTPCEARTPRRRLSPTPGRDRDRPKGEGPPDLVMRRLPEATGEAHSTRTGEKTVLVETAGKRLLPWLPWSVITSALAGGSKWRPGEDAEDQKANCLASRGLGVLVCTDSIKFENHQNALTRAANS
ncbi:serine/arginine repetitive matrix protein 1-like isoform X4 [Canis lupus familiaris]|uniref:serine/arginine repetitive matrix protein 1-like isoform X4 n=1 Tax=Canis lupus familiaris TaxID=9615 RepID=UPI0018F6E2C4|nr:serine/arginine repetitive matrix protein 1-like isoform X4 [Canis lupus familiaris]XP_038523452.1 serine/arginine repetitive matrix protein 1-like isoform X1 [Canis lupus familiaris]